MENGPFVSILMTCFNRQDFIREAIESVLASTYKNFELIVVDDCSTDATLETARKYAAADARMKVYTNEKNLGDYPNRNRAASYAKGEYLFYLDSDDIMHADGIEKCMSYILQYPQAKFITYYRLPAKETFLLDSVTAIRNHFFVENYLMIGPGGTIVNREFFKQINGFPEKYGPANDTYYNLKAASQSPVLMLPFMFFHYRIHPGQEINNAYSYMYNNYRYFNDAINELDLPLSKKEKTWLQNKNKRRFLLNVLRFLHRSKDVKKTMNAVRLAEYKFKDALVGVFHF